MDFGAMLEYIRTQRKISIYKISKTTGLSNSYIRDLERGKRNPSLDTLCRISVPLGVSVSELLNESEELSYLSAEEKNIIENIRLLSDEKRDALLHMLRVLRSE